MFSLESQVGFDYLAVLIYHNVWCDCHIAVKGGVAAMLIFVLAKSCLKHFQPTKPDYVPKITMSYICLSTKSFLDLNDIWYLGRGRWVLLDGTLYDPIQGQGHGGLKVAKMAYFEVYLLCWYSCNLTTNGGLWYSKTISELFLDRFLKLVGPHLASRNLRSYRCYEYSTSSPVWDIFW